MKRFQHPYTKFAKIAPAMAKHVRDEFFPKSCCR